MTEMQRNRVRIKGYKRAANLKPSWMKAPKRIKKKRISFWSRPLQKDCGSTLWFRDSNGNWRHRFISNRTKRFGVVHDRAVKMSLI